MRIVNDRSTGVISPRSLRLPLMLAVVGEVVGVTADAQLVVGLAVVAAAHHELALVVALEAGAWHDVEYPVGAIALVGRVAAALASR